MTCELKRKWYTILYEKCLHHHTNDQLVIWQVACHEYFSYDFPFFFSKDVIQIWLWFLLVEKCDINYWFRKFGALGNSINKRDGKRNGVMVNSPRIFCVE